MVHPHVAWVLSVQVFAAVVLPWLRAPVVTEVHLKEAIEEAAVLSARIAVAWAILHSEVMLVMAAQVKIVELYILADADK